MSGTTFSKVHRFHTDRSQAAIRKFASSFRWPGFGHQSNSSVWQVFYQI
jgi:hypothetical protein